MLGRLPKDDSHRPAMTTRHGSHSAITIPQQKLLELSLTACIAVVTGMYIDARIMRRAAKLAMTVQ